MNAWLGHYDGGRITQRVLITGGTGFIGAHLVRSCLARGQEVTVAARPDSDPWRLRDVADQITLRRVALYDQAEVTALLRDTRPQRIFHLAATHRICERASLADLEHAQVCNVEPLRNLLNGLRKINHIPRAFVRTGTLAELGESTGSHDPESCERPADAYGLSALLGTHMLRIARERMDFPAVTARLCLTYGGDQSSDFLIPDMIRKGLAGRSPRLRRPQSQRDILHVDDCVAALHLIADHAARLPPVLSLSTGDPQPMVRVAGMIADILGRGTPGSVQNRPSDPGAVLSCRPSPELSALGWRPRVPLSTGLRRVIEWERRAAAGAESLPL